MKTKGGNFRKGAALPFVAVVFVVITAAAGIMFSFFNANLKTTVLQEKNIQAYYHMQTGLEMGTAALLTQVDNPYYISAWVTPHLPEKITILDNYLSDPLKPPLTQTINLPNGSVTVRISSPLKPGSMLKWIRVESEGVYKDGSDTEYKNKGSVWYRADNPAISEQTVDN
ncbi:MAG: hypothetical protein LBS84_12160 [Clostridiales bacterium]|jgi:hypothetical protein|nr:hypothetical protein [Clostridiales bacterium]